VVVDPNVLVAAAITDGVSARLSTMRARTCDRSMTDGPDSPESRHPRLLQPV
jgi:hypothetical protein